MNARQFFDAVAEMRRLQRQYKISNNETTLKLMQAAEFIVDSVIRTSLERLEKRGVKKDES